MSGDGLEERLRNIDADVSRRAALKGGATGLAAVYASLLAGQVQASNHGVSEPRINLGDEYHIDDDPNGNGDLVLFHAPSGDTIATYDRSENEWVLDSVQTDDQTINTSLTYGSHDIGAILEATSSGDRIETGTTDPSSLSGASDDGWDTSNNTDDSATFSTAFSSTPQMLVNESVVTRQQATNISTTGFDLRTRNFQTSTRDIGATDWWAIGGD